MDQNQPTGRRPEASQKNLSNLFNLSLILAIFTFLLAGLTGYLTYQNILLRQQIQDLSQQPPQEQTQTQTIPTDQPSPSPSLNPTADWQTYENSLYSYMFKYPQNMLVEMEDQNTVSYKHIVSLKPQLSNSIQVLTIMTNMGDFESAAKILRDNADSYKGGEQTLDLPNFKTAKKFTYLTGAGDSDYIEHYIVKNNDFLHEIMISYNNPANSSDLKQIHQILSTFQFPD